MNQQFLRMQQLAGVKVQPAFDELAIEALTEYYLYNNYYSKGILKENINKIDWYGLSENPNAINILKNNIHKFDFDYGLDNPNPDIIYILKLYIQIYNIDD